MRGSVIMKEQSSSSDLNHQNTELNHLKNVYKHGLIFCKNVLKRIKKDRKRTFEKTDTISRDQFLSYTKSVWIYEPKLISEDLLSTINTIDSDMLTRFLHLYSFSEDFVLFIHNENQNHLRKICKSVRKNSIFYSILEFTS